MPLDHDTAIRISLIGTAERRYSERGDRAAAVAELQDLASGRTDLLAEAAGHFLGMNTWTIPEATTTALACHQLLVDAGADPALIEAAAEITRKNIAGGGHTSAGTTSKR